MSAASPWFSQACGISGIKCRLRDRTATANPDQNQPIWRHGRGRPHTIHKRLISWVGRRDFHRNVCLGFAIGRRAVSEQSIQPGSNQSLSGQRALPYQENTDLSTSYAATHLITAAKPFHILRAGNAGDELSNSGNRLGTEKPGMNVQDYNPGHSGDHKRPPSDLFQA